MADVAEHSVGDQSRLKTKGEVPLSVGGDHDRDTEDAQGEAETEPDVG